MRSKKSGTILFVLDERLSREKATLLTRTINALRVVADLHIISGGITQEELAKKIEEKNPQLVLAPWYRYFAWSKIEAFWGLTRTSGPAFAGYFCDSLLPYELETGTDFFRAILLDFANTSPAENITLLLALMNEKKRTGLLPLLVPDTSVYCENWYAGQGLGTRIDAVLGLPELSANEWTPRASAVRLALSAFWSLVYEYGPGKSEFHQAITANSPKAYFQVAADKRVLALRLCYSVPGWSPKEAIRAFWPRGQKPTGPAQILLRYTDFLRVHMIPDKNELEIVAGYFMSGISEKAPEQVHTIWIEPVSANLVSEIPYEAPSPLSRHLKLLPNVPLGESKLRSEQTAQRERFIVEAAVKIRELKQMLQGREEMIRDLRAGGVGTAPPLPPPDMEALFNAFQERFFEARFHIRQFEVQIAQMEDRGATPGEVEALKSKMQALAAKEESWIQQLATTIETVRMARKG